MPDSPVNSDLNELRRGYLSSLNEKLSVLKDAAATQDYAAVVRLGHQLKGSGRSYGFPEISELGRRIEQVGLDHRAALLESIIAEFRELKETLNSVQ